VEAAGERLAQPYEAWIAARIRPRAVRALITGPQGFERTVAFARDEGPKRIVSPAARRRMAAAQRKRWAAARKAKVAAAAARKAKAAGKSAAPKKATPAAGRGQGGKAAAPAMPV
jgi:hypothetical protein